MSTRMQRYHLTHSHQLSVGPKFFKSTRRVRCPKCNFEFSLMYSRAIACQGCREAVFGCNLARCPRCDSEFRIDELSIASTKVRSKVMGNYMAATLSDYYKSVGEKPSR